RPVDLHETRLGLDQPPGQQTRLAKARPAIAVADDGRLIFEAKGTHGLRCRKKRQRLSVIAVAVLPAGLRPFAQSAAEVDARAHPAQGGGGGQVEPFETQLASGVIVHREGIVRASQQTGSLSDASDAAFADRATERHIRQRATAGGTVTRYDGADGGQVLA